MPHWIAAGNVKSGSLPGIWRHFFPSLWLTTNPCGSQTPGGMELLIKTTSLLLPCLHISEFDFFFLLLECNTKKYHITDIKETHYFRLNTNGLKLVVLLMWHSDWDLFRADVTFSFITSVNALCCLNEGCTTFVLECLYCEGDFLKKDEHRILFNHIQNPTKIEIRHTYSTEALNVVL